MATTKRSELFEGGSLENPSHERTLEWLEGTPGILDAFVGEWVAIEGTTIVAHDPSVRLVTEAARCQGFADPLLIPVSATPHLIT